MNAKANVCNIVVWLDGLYRQQVAGATVSLAQLPKAASQLPINCDRDAGVARKFIQCTRAIPVQNLVQTTFDLHRT